MRDCFRQNIFVEKRIHQNIHEFIEFCIGNSKIELNWDFISKIPTPLNDEIVEIDQMKFLTYQGQRSYHYPKIWERSLKHLKMFVYTLNLTN